MSFGEFIKTPNTVGMWHLNGLSVDSSGNGLNGIDENITYGKQYGKFNEGASFNGSNSRIILPASSALDLHTFSHTTISWVKISAYSTGKYQYYIFAKGSFAMNKTYYGCRIARNGKVEYYISSNQDANFDYIITDGVVPLNKWNCIIGVWDKPNRNIKIYLNGSIMTGTITLVGATLPIYTESINAYLGGAHGNISYGYFAGSMDELIFENRIWTPQEVQKYYTNALGRF
jgi:hypothetical protein